MVKTARIAAVVALASILAAVPARALSLKDWDAKSDNDQVNYLGACVARLVADVAKTDRPLSLRIKSYYADKPPGQKYTDGTGALLMAIFSLLNQAKTDRRVDPAKIEIEDIVLRTTAEKFKLPNTVASAGKSAGARAPAPTKPDFQPADPPRPSPKPAPEPVGFGDLITGGIIRPPVYHISKFDPDWVGSTRTLEGTVSKATVEKPDVVRILFSEAPDGSFQVFTPLVAELRARYGADLSGLVGKTVQIDGEILHFTGTKGGIRFTDLKQLKLVP